MKSMRFWPQHGFSRLSGILWGGVALGSALLFLLPALPRFQPVPFIDSAVFLYIGWQWTEGYVPYRDLWDHKPPLIYLHDALGYWLTGGQAGAWLIEVLLVALALGFLLWALYRWARSLWAMIAALPVFWSAFQSTYLRNMTENDALPWQAGMLWLLTYPHWGGWHYIGLGAFTGLAAMARPNTALAGGVILAYQLWASARAKKPRWYLGGGWWLLGILGVWGPVVAYFWQQNALADFWEAVVLFNLAYRQAGAQAAWWTQMLKLLQFIPMWVGWLALVGLAVRLRSRQSNTPAPGWVYALILLVEVVAVSLPRRAVVHYAMNFVPIFTFWAAVGLAFFLEHWHSLYRWRYAGAAVALSLLWLSPFPKLVNWAVSPHKYQHSAYINAAQFLEQYTSPEEEVFLWGEIRVNVLAQRRSPTRYIILPPPYYPRSRTHLVRFLSDLETHAPVFIVDTFKTGTSVWDLWQSYPDLQSRAAALRQRYQEAHRMQVGKRTWVFYILRSEAQRLETEENP